MSEHIFGAYYDENMQPGATLYASAPLSFLVQSLITCLHNILSCTFPARRNPPVENKHNHDKIPIIKQE